MPVETEIEKLMCDHARSRDKLANIDYLPPEVVAREHGRSAEIEAAIETLHEQHRRVESLNEVNGAGTPGPWLRMR